MQFRKKVQ